jgi:hypothetical protein
MISPSYAILVITRLAFLTNIAWSFEEFLTLISKQHPLGTVIIAVDVTFPYSSTAAGVKMDLLLTLCSPFTAMDTAIGVTVAPSGNAIFPLYVTE